jgi:drug/metabolite transporter (DMT)-like permease
MRIAVRWVVVALVVGAVLIVLGTVVIVGARHTSNSPYPPGNVFFVPYVWNTFQLATGIALALVGAATSTASLIYLHLNRKKKGV